MSTLTINGNNIYNYFISGAKKLIYNEKMLNSINVFPVADGDTGTNLAMTMKMIVSNSKNYNDINKTLTSISDIATENAYGNSGMIFAQFLNGFAEGTKNKYEISISEFAEIAKLASDYAYEAVDTPKEGTILSVMRDWAVDLKEKSDLVSFEHLLDKSIRKVQHLVEQTKHKMKVLIDNNVVDAGAKGFQIFLEGILEYVKRGKIIDTYDIDNADFDKHKNIFHDAVVTKNRYCSQFYVETDKEVANLKKQLSDLGDSLVITGKKNKKQIHIHTDYPEKVMQRFVSEDTILSHKIEDMKISNSIIHNSDKKIGIVTDSIADISQDLIDKENITVIPVNLICDSVVYLDKLTMTPELFYKNIDSYEMNPTSAQPSYSVIEKSFIRLLDHFDSLIGIFVSKKMSGTYNNAKKAAKKLEKQGMKISVIDSMLNSAAEGLLVLEASKLVDEGLKHEKIVEELNVIKSNIKIFVSVKDLSYMIKGGRVSKVAGFILNKLKLQPVVSIDQKGKGIVFKKTFTQKRAEKSILSTVESDFRNEGIRKYSVVYSDKKEDSTNFRRKLAKIIGKEPEYFSPISPVIGLNAGKGTYAVAYIKGGC